MRRSASPARDGDKWPKGEGLLLMFESKKLPFAACRNAYPLFDPNFKSKLHYFANAAIAVIVKHGSGGQMMHSEGGMHPTTQSASLGISKQLCHF